MTRIDVPVAIAEALDPLDRFLANDEIGSQRYAALMVCIARECLRRARVEVPEECIPVLRSTASVEGVRRYERDA